MPVETLHKNETKLSIEIIRELLNDQFPDWADLSIKPLSHQGTDNVMLKLGNDKIIRLPRTQRSEASLIKECLWLPIIGDRLSIQIPHIIGNGQPSKEYPYQWAIVNFLQGSSPSDNNPLDLAQAAIDLSRVRKELQSVDTTDAPLCSRKYPSIIHDAETSPLIPALSDTFDSAQITKLWEAALDLAPWQGNPVWLHGDIHTGNLLVQDGAITGIIDFGMSGIGDPACDLMVAWTLFTKDTRQIFHDAVAPDQATWNRAKAYALHFGIMAYSYYKDRDPFVANIAKNTLGEVINDSSDEYSGIIG
ncbi:MAG: aminoglycoside phosphotransferase family protein [Alphaproteobacteria bacterium]